MSGEKRRPWRYTLDSVDTALTVPADAVVMTVAVNPHDGVPVVWLEVDPARERRVLRRFVLVRNGEDIPPGPLVWYLSTVWLPSGVEVHVYELGSDEKWASDMQSELTEPASPLDAVPWP